MAYGHYVHSKYENYLTYGLVQKAGGKPIDPMKALDDQSKEIQRRSIEAKYTNKAGIKKIEDQLNTYFDVIKGNKIDDRLTQEQLDMIHQAILEYYEKIMKNKTIDRETLAASVTGGNNSLALELSESFGTIFEKELQAILAHKNVSENESISISNIEKKLSELILLRKKIGESSIKVSNALSNYLKEIDALDKLWKDILSDAKTVTKKYSFNTGKGKDDTYVLLSSHSSGRDFAQRLNAVIRIAKIAKAQLAAGTYAEAMAAATMHVLNKHAFANVEEVKQLFVDKVLGQNKHKKLVDNYGWLNYHIDGNVFGKESKDEKQTYSGGKSRIKDAAGNYVSTHETQDKVDIILEFEGLEIPASIKNYNLAGKLPGITFHSGSSVYELIQDFKDFAFHYMNIKGTHTVSGDLHPSQTIINEADRILKLTMLLKALAGGFKYSIDESKGTVGYSQEADLIVLNDNSQGKYKVYSINEILNRVEEQVNLITLGNELDNSGYLLPNDFIASSNPNKIYSIELARQRITLLLNKLDAMKLHISIDKTVFKKDFT